MKKAHLVFFVSVFLIVLFAAGAALAAPQQGVLVDENGTPLDGFSHVWIIDGVAQPVYNPSTHLWYSVFILGPGENGAIFCTLGAPLGTKGNFRGGHGHQQHEFSNIPSVATSLN
jgi:hypothetical protein